MMARPLLCDVMINPELTKGLSLRQWDLLIRQARHADLLARLAWLLEGNSEAPEAAQRHLDSAWAFAQRQAQSVRYEVASIKKALSDLQIPVLLLKGAAYVMAGLPSAQGRLLSDIDILVPWDRMESVENALLLHGWRTTHHDAYDQKYYRQWMHEIPPMKHGQRGSVIDVHHAILPPTARLKPDSQKMMAAAVAVAGQAGIYTFAPVDMVLHSATHLFHEGELEHGLRDLVDLDALLRHFGTDNAFWEQLVERAAELDLRRPLFYALHYCARMVNTPVPPFAMKAAAALGRPPAMFLMDALFGRALRPDHSSCDDGFTPLARWLLYIRSHYLRMPFQLLLPHLLRKALKNHKGSTSLAEPAVEKE